MRHRRMPLILTFLLVLIVGPYIAAALALLAVLWLVVMLIALPFSIAGRR